MMTAEHFEAFTRAVEARCPPMREAAFGIGWIVRSTRNEFRGAIINVDPVYDSDADWLEANAADPAFAVDQPWYIVIGEDRGGPKLLYVPEGLLERDDSLEPVQNPAIATYFIRFCGDRYDYHPRRDA